jgi:hypothetical protein
MNILPQQNFTISVEKQFASHMAKASFPLRYGKYNEIRTSDYEFLFNLNGEIKFIRGLGMNWPHPAEQLKRTDGNDWVYYSVGDNSGDNGVISWLGEYYLPCLPYASNSIWELNYYANPSIMGAFAAWSQLYANLYDARNRGLHTQVKEVVGRILTHDDRILFERSQRLNTIIGERISVLPPDTRHVDYEVIPLTIADGCLYHCKFCCIKSEQKYQPRSPKNIIEQIQLLKNHYGRNLKNYNALFLGNHDALAAGGELIQTAAIEAKKGFGLGGPGVKTPFLFMFGSVDSFLKAGNGLFEKLSQLPFYTYLNIGLESIDAATLALIGKPVGASKAREAFQQMLKLNTQYANIEVTGNFLLGEHLSSDHYQSIAELLQNAARNSSGKGAIYFSPLKDSPKKRELLPQFLKIKNHSQLPTFIYLIQRI